MWAAWRAQAYVLVPDRAPQASQEVVLEEMVVGVLLFLPLLVLLPTTLAWHLLAALPCGAALALLGALSALHTTLQVRGGCGRGSLARSLQRRLPVGASGAHLWNRPCTRR